MLFKAFTVKHDLTEITLRIWFDEELGRGGVVSFLDEHFLNRAFFDRYDNMEVNSVKDFHRRVKYYEKKHLNTY
jgi:hypothetical protein